MAQALWDRGPSGRDYKTSLLYLKLHFLNLLLRDWVPDGLISCPYNAIILLYA
jgi:hypothetical protein